MRGTEVKIQINLSFLRNCRGMVLLELAKKNMLGKTNKEERASEAIR